MGTGLGLSIVKRLTELMGGRVSASSEVDKGSVFTCEIPFVVAEMKKKVDSPAMEVKAVDFTGKLILLVEDNALNQLVAEKFLQWMGFEVEIAGNGVEAIEAMKKKRYDAVLMDLQMPEMDGYETTRFIREKMKGRNRIIPILAMTAHAIRGEEEKCINAGMNDYISKPLNRNVLMDKLERLLAIE
jgi:two-component system, sensor histidine kinase